MRFQFHVKFFMRDMSTSVLQATCVMKVKLVEVLIITYTSAVHWQWKWHIHTHTQKYTTKTQTPKKSQVSHSLRKAASLETQ